LDKLELGEFKPIQMFRFLSQKWKALGEVQLVEVRVSKESGASALIYVSIELLCLLWENVLDD